MRKLMEQASSGEDTIYINIVESFDLFDVNISIHLLVSTILWEDCCKLRDTQACSLAACKEAGDCEQ